MNTPRFMLLLCLCLLALAPAARASDQPAQPQAREKTTEWPKLPDPNDPTVSPEERLARQKAIMLQRIKQRQEREAEEARKNGKVTELDPKTLAAEPGVNATIVTLLMDLRGEVKALRDEVRGLMSKQGARPAKPQPTEQAKSPKTCRLELELASEGAKPQKLLGFGGEKFEISAPLVKRGQGESVAALGSFQFTTTLAPAADGSALLDYHIIMSVPVIQKNSQVTYDMASMGQVTVKFGETKEIWRVDDASVKLTLKPE